MTDLSELIPPHEPSEDAFGVIGGMALDSIPVLGPMAGRALDYALASKAAQRRHEFDRAVVDQLEELARELGGTLTVADVVSSDDFQATLARVQRNAAESASATKRARLARAAMTPLRPSTLSSSERSDFLRFVEELDDLHVFLLSYFVSPRAWLDAHNKTDAYSGVEMGSPIGPLAAALNFSPDDDDQRVSSVDSALATLERYGLASVPARTIMMRDGTLQRRTSDRGQRFLDYLREGEHSEAEPPANAWS